MTWIADSIGSLSDYSITSSARASSVAGTVMAHGPIAADAMRSLFVVGFLLVFLTWGGQAVHAQPAAGAGPHIEWEVKN